MFVDPCIIVQFIKKNPTRCNNVPKFYYPIFMWSSTCFGRHTAHHQEPKTALAASGFSYVESCWTCSWWTLSGTVWVGADCTYSYCARERPPTTRSALRVQCFDDRSVCLCIKMSLVGSFFFALLARCLFLDFYSSICRKSAGDFKCKVHPRTVHEGPERE